MPCTGDILTEKQLNELGWKKIDSDGDCKVFSNGTHWLYWEPLQEKVIGLIPIL